MTYDPVTGQPLKPCANPACGRMTSLLSDYCCAPCLTAEQGGYECEPHDPDQPEHAWLGHHSLGCEGRYNLRRAAGRLRPGHRPG